MSLIFKIFLILIQIHSTLSDKCAIKPFNFNIETNTKESEATIPTLTVEILQKGKDGLTAFLGQPTGFKSDGAEHKERISNCLASCYGIVFYTDSCQKFKIDGLAGELIYKSLNPILKTDSANLKNFPVIDSIVTNVDTCLASPTVEKDLGLIGSKGFHYLLRITYLRLSGGKETLTKGDILKNQGFLSTTIDPKAMGAYEKNQKHVLVFSSEFEQGASQIRGKLVKPCSLVPIDNEFLMARNQCWKVMHIMDLDTGHNIWDQIKLYRASIENKIENLSKTNDLLEVPNIVQKYNFDLGKKRNKILRILTADLNKETQKANVVSQSGNIPDTFHSKRIFLQPVECANPELEYAAIM